MLARELSIALRSRLTWLQAALTALLVGHGFVLAIDVYSSGSRSVRAHTLMAREFDPLLGIVRPTLGGLYLALSLLGPLVAARMLAVEKERHTLHALLLQTGSTGTVLLAKFAAGLVAVGVQLLAPLLLLALFRTLGGHLAWSESLVAFLGYALYSGLVTALALMAAAWTQSLPQAAALTVLLVLSSWAIDASEGFGALAWLHRALDWSVSPHLEALERGTLALGACAFFLVLTAGGLGLAWVGLRYDRSIAWRACAALVVLLGTATAGSLCQQIQRGFDCTEQRRASLPFAVVRALRALPASIALEVWLDRDDARRQQLQTDALAKLKLARPDLVVATPTDERNAPQQGEREPDYGRIIVRVGAQHRHTYSTSRRELTTLIFEAAGQPPPSFEQREYPGYPLILEGPRRSVAAWSAYLGLPSTMLLLGWSCTRSHRRRT